MRVTLKLKLVSQLLTNLELTLSSEVAQVHTNAFNKSNFELESDFLRVIGARSQKEGGKKVSNTND